MKEGEN